MAGEKHAKGDPTKEQIAAKTGLIKQLIRDMPVEHAATTEESDDTSIRIIPITTEGFSGQVSYNGKLDRAVNPDVEGPEKDLYIIGIGSGPEDRVAFTGLDSSGELALSSTSGESVLNALNAIYDWLKMQQNPGLTQQRQ